MRLYHVEKIDDVEKDRKYYHVEKTDDRRKKRRRQERASVSCSQSWMRYGLAVMPLARPQCGRTPRIRTAPVPRFARVSPQRCQSNSTSSTCCCKESTAVKTLVQRKIKICNKNISTAPTILLKLSQLRIQTDSC